MTTVAWHGIEEKAIKEVNAIAARDCLNMIHLQRLPAVLDSSV
ncbi:hypothetical protein GPEL0_01f2804 [Geoanaerobacter pelophilus]|uniref:Uncharacterized protein n=1 Tax=Geoanaerobacter pelophilus TaxID=60036 RepID=A0ABQ0MJ83_9BACT|nr:hypothetical protein GPEL0_01f2804 [Geoanaerobacter pelophilus]